MDTLANAFVTLLIVVDPIGVAWVFAGLTYGQDTAYQRRMAVKGVLLSAAILLIFFFLGDLLLGALGIGIPAFRIAGGVLFFLIALDMVFARQSGLRSTTAREEAEAELSDDISVFPLAFPLIAGPGAMTTVLMMESSRHAPPLYWGLLGMLLLVLALSLLALLAAQALMRALGETGANVISRILGLLLAALAAQYIMDGIKTGFGV